MGTRADQLLLGCALAFLTYAIPRNASLARVTNAARFGIWPAAVVLAAVAVAVPVNGLRGGAAAVSSVGGPLLVGLLAAVLIGGLAWHPNAALARLLAWRPVAWVGRDLSYAIYLWHYPILLLLVALGLSAPIAAAVALPFTFAIACLSRTLIERPIRLAVRTRVEARVLRS